MAGTVKRVPLREALAPINYQRQQCQLLPIHTPSSRTSTNFNPGKNQNCHVMCSLQRHCLGRIHSFKSKWRFNFFFRFHILYIYSLIADAFETFDCNSHAVFLLLPTSWFDESISMRTPRLLIRILIEKKNRESDEALVWPMTPNECPNFIERQRLRRVGTIKCKCVNTKK